MVHPGLTQWKLGLQVNLQVISHCNRKCPRCACRDFVSGEPYVASVESVVRDIKAIGKVNRIYLSGGEITLHPHLEELLRAAREVSIPGTLWIFTNGARLVENAISTKHVDGVMFSVFDGGSDVGAGVNSSTLAAYRSKKPQGVLLCDGVARHKINSGNSPCSMRNTTIGVCDGRVYSCCVAAGMNGAIGTELSAGWEERVRELPVPCGRCVFGVSR